MSGNSRTIPILMTMVIQTSIVICLTKINLIPVTIKMMYISNYLWIHTLITDTYIMGRKSRTSLNKLMIKPNNVVVMTNADAIFLATDVYRSSEMSLPTLSSLVNKTYDSCRCISHQWFLDLPSFLLEISFKNSKSLFYFYFLSSWRTKILFLHFCYSVTSFKQIIEIISLMLFLDYCFLWQNFFYNIRFSIG